MVDCRVNSVNTTINPALPFKKHPFGNQKFFNKSKIFLEGELNDGQILVTSKASDNEY